METPLNQFKTSKELEYGYMKAGIKKANSNKTTLFILGIFAGMFIAFGAACSMAASHGIADAGLAKLAAGMVFPVGLMLIVLVGGELFTGDCLMILGVMHGQYSVGRMVKKLTLIWGSNFVGALIVVVLIAFSAQQELSGGMLGAYTIKVAYGKASLSFFTAFVSGVACNIIVCATVLMAYGANDVIGKVGAIFFPILLFVVGGFEHCVANMYYLPAGLLAVTNDTYLALAMETYGLNLEQLSVLNMQNILLGNLLPVTLGNIVGGTVFIGLPLFILYGDKGGKSGNDIKLEQPALAKHA